MSSEYSVLFTQYRRIATVNTPGFEVFSCFGTVEVAVVRQQRIQGGNTISVVPLRKQGAALFYLVNWRF